MIARISVIAPYGICAILFLTHITMILKYGVDVPFWDEWSFLEKDVLRSFLNIKWIFKQHNEHRIVLTKLLNGLLYYLTSWNIVISMVVNMFLFAGVVGIVYLFFKELKKEEKKVAVWFLPFLFSNIALENFTWSFQSQFHFFLLFFFAGVLLLFKVRASRRDLLLGSFFSLLSLFSFSAGVVCNIALLIGFSLWSLSQTYWRETSNSHKKNIWVILAILSGLVLWFGLGYSKPPGHPLIVLPYRVAFFKYFFNILSLGFGFKKISSYPGILCFSLILFPIAYSFWNGKTRRDPRTWATATVVAGLLGSLISISMGRAAFGVDQSKASRYAEISMMLIPFSVMAWQIFLRDFPKFKFPMIASYWFFLFLAFWPDWEMKEYQNIFNGRRAGLACIEKYYQTGENDLCLNISPTSLKAKLVEAKELEVSFYKKIAAK